MAEVKGPNLRLNPREIEEAVSEERKKWRIFRLQQVREQARQDAERVRRNVRQKEKQMVETIGREVLEKWQKEKENKVQQLQEEYDNCFQAFGRAHREARDQPDANEVLAQNMAINRKKAVKRGQEAKKATVEEKSLKEREKIQVLQQRNSALRKEKLRANRIAQLPTPEAFKKKKVIVPEPVPMVQLYEHGTLTTTNYVPKHFVIEKEVLSTKPSAQKLAEAEEIAQAAVKERERREVEECERKREERGKIALQKERLRRHYKELMEQLDQAQRDHHLSAYMKGVDDSLYETEESRLKRLATLQHDLEAAAERVLQGKSSLASKDTEDTGEESDLKEISSDSKTDAVPETLSAREREFKDLREDIKKTRRHILDRIISSRDSSAERMTTEVEEADIGESEQRREERDGEDIEVVDEGIGQDVSRRPDPIHHIDPRTKDIDSSEEGVASSITNKDFRATGRRIHGDFADLHLAETVPVHLLPKDRDYKRIPVQPMSREDQQEVPLLDSPSVQSSSEGTILPISSSDINIKIHLSDDSTYNTLTPPYKYTDPLIAPKEGLYRKRPIADLHSSGSSTDYMSLPSAFSPGRLHLHYQDNLRRIQEQRHNIQRLLDSKGKSINNGRLTPVTYMQEMNKDGRGRRPLSKKEKFELKKREILHHYLRKLVTCNEEGVLQLSASTVEGSGITVSSIDALLDSLNREDENSVFSSLVDFSESSSVRVSSPIYPDIDKIPTKLSSSEISVSTGILPISHSSCSGHGEFSSEISHPSHAGHDMNNFSCVGHRLAHHAHGSLAPPSPHHLAHDSMPLSHGLLPSLHAHESPPPPPNNIVIHINDNGIPPASLPSRTPLAPTTIRSFPNPISRRPEVLAIPCSDLSHISEEKSSDANLQRELLILQQLQALQRLKQELLLKKNDLVKDTEDRYTSLRVLEPDKYPQSIGSEHQGTRITFRNRSDHHSMSDLAEDSLITSDTSSSAESDRAYQYKPLRSSTLPSKVVSGQRKGYLESDVGQARSEFVRLQPEYYGQSETSLSRGVFPNQSLTGTHFLPLIPESTLPTGKKSAEKPPLLKSNTAFKTLIPVSCEDKEDESEIVIQEIDRNDIQDETRNTEKLSTQGLDKGDPKQVFDPSKYASPKSNEIVTSIEKHQSSHDNPTQSDKSQEVSEIITTEWNPKTPPDKNDNDSSNDTGKSASLTGNSRKTSSSESVGSIPDMGEILQRFGLTWAHSMIRKMDKTEENSSSGN